MRTLPAILSDASELTIQFPAPDTGDDYRQDIRYEVYPLDAIYQVNR